MSYRVSNSSLTGYQITPTNVLHNIIPPLIEIDSSPDEYLFYKEAIITGGKGTPRLLLSFE